ncbi:coiled-coil domain-containing protein 185 [Lissotriton helveticus]
MGDAEPAPPPVHLDLNNFEETQHEGSRYVLTSPRSLEACALQGVRPVELLYRPLAEFVWESPDAPLPLATARYEVHEKERRRKLRQCREQRRRLVAEEKREPPPGDAGDRADHSRAVLQCQGERKLDRPSQEPKAEVNGGQKGKPDRPAGHKDKHEGPSAGPKEKQPGRPARKLPTRPEGPPCSKSLSLGDLSRSSEATSQRLRQLAAEVEREAQVSVPERDKKIAALMLLKHQEERAMELRRREADRAWEEARRSELRSRRRRERERKAQLGRRLLRWQQDLAERRARLRQEERAARALLEREAQRGESRRKQHAEEEGDRRHQELERIKKQAEYRRRGLERVRREREVAGKVARERGGRRLQQRMGRALQLKVQREAQERRKLKALNEENRLRHSSKREQAESQAQAEELLRRLSLEHKSQRSHEAYEQAAGERSRELKERAAREDEQIQRALERAERLQQEETRHKQQLVQLSELKIQQAREQAQLSMQDRAGRAREVNLLKERAHHILKMRVDEEEKSHRREVQHSIHKKDQKCDQMQREKEAVLEEARKVARASFQMREKVREQIKARTFDQMVLEAKLNASLIKDNSRDCRVPSTGQAAF